jgi:hypothetical protein
VPLSRVQSEVLRTLVAHRSADSYVAGSRQATAPIDGSNRKARERGRAYIRESVKKGDEQAYQLPDDLLIELWREGIFVFLSSLDQIDELRRVTRYPEIRDRLTPSLAGRLINEVRDLAMMATDLPEVAICNDPTDNCLLGIAKAGRGGFRGQRR